MKSRSLSKRDLLLIITLGVLAVIWLATWPLRSRLSRETARIEEDTARKSEAIRTLKNLQDEEDAARRRVTEAPKSLEARLALASVLGRQRKYPEAIKEIRTAESLDPKSAEPHTALGQIYDANGLPDLAIMEFTRALELDPNQSQALTLLAYKYVAMGWNDSAERLLLRALPSLPNDSRVHVTLGLVYFQKSNLAAAEQELQTARRLAPTDATIFGPLIEVYRNGQKYDKALQTIDEAMRVTPNKTVLENVRAQTYLLMNNAPAAIAAADRVLASQPDHLHALYTRAVAEKMQGKTDDAIRDLETIRAKEARFEDTLMHLGQLYTQKGETEKGRQFIEQYNVNRGVREKLSRLTLRVAARPNDADAHMELGRYYLQGQSYARSVVELKRYLELKPNDPQGLALLAQALQGAGRKPEANAILAGRPE